MVVLVAVTISGTLMYFVENTLPKLMAAGELTVEEKAVIDKNFGSIPQSMYWAIVTMTTVGYGDIVPQTTIGKFISATLILLGYSLIIVPSGFVTAELTSKKRPSEPGLPIEEKVACPRCASTEHHEDAVYCYRCGERIR
jgi:voltage-gated potassium channel